MISSRPSAPIPLKYASHLTEDTILCKPFIAVGLYRLAGSRRSTLSSRAAAI